MEKIPEIIHESWHPFLQPLFDDDRMKHIKYNYLPLSDFLPNPQDIFKVFRMPMSDIKVVILGQDPYPTPKTATGLAFQVRDGVKTPLSLQIMYKEILSSGQGSVKVIEGNTHHYGNINSWEEQGVFLLNTALTVERNNAGRHLRLWRWFTEEVIAIIAKEIGPVWMLWGKKAQEFRVTIHQQGNLNNKVLTAPHPAAEGYSGGKAGFIGSGVFQKANEIIIQRYGKRVNF